MKRFSYLLIGVRFIFLMADSALSRTAPNVDLAVLGSLKDTDVNTSVGQTGVSVTNTFSSIAQSKSLTASSTISKNSLCAKGEGIFSRREALNADRCVLKRPAVDENFLTMRGILNPDITFSRTSSATFVGINGLIQAASTNRPRFDYNPKTLALNGLLCLNRAVPINN